MNKHKILVSVRILGRVLKEKDIIVEGEADKKVRNKCLKIQYFYSDQK